MAINFLNSVDFNKNELLNPTIENQPNDTAAGTGVEGQLYFNTTDDILKVYAGGSWVEVGGGVTSLTTTDGTYINLTPNSATTGAVTVTADLSATDGTAGVGERYLAKSGVWATIASIPGTYTFDTSSNSGSETVDSGDTLEISGGTYITGATSKLGTTVTTRLDHDSTSRTDTTSTDAPGYGGTFEAVTSVTTNATGHVTAIDVSTVTIPSAENYSWDVSDGTNTEAINSGDTVTWTGSGTTTVSYSTSSNTFTINSADQYQGTVTSVGTGNSTFISGSGGPITGSGSLTYSLSATGTPSSSTYLRGDNTWAALPADNDNYVDSISFNTGSGVLTLGRTGALADLTQDLDGRYLELDGGTMTGDINMDTNQITNLPDPTSAQDAATKAYVDAATVGGLVYQGGYNAATNTPDLDSSPSSSIKKGWTYTVTADGSFFTEQVRVGDVLIAENDAPTTLAEWTTVQNNIDLASLTQVGIGNVNASTVNELEGLRVTYSNGTATVGFDIDSLTQSTPTTNADAFLPYYDDAVGENKKLTFTQLATELADEINTETSFAATITDTATITHSLATRDVIIQLYDTVTYETVYADVDRISTTQATITFATTPTNSIRVLVQKIG